MGYVFDMRGRLCCDRCGTSGGVRRRTCPHTVLSDSLRGGRQRLPWCSPPAYCSGCYKAAGGVHGIHDQHEAPAAEDQAKADAIEAALDAGESFVCAAWGDWAEGVPAGMAGVVFRGRAGECLRLVPAAAYEPGAKPRLSDYPEAEPWPAPNAARRA